MQKLMTKSIEIKHGVTKAFWYQSNTTEILNLQEQAAKFHGRYAMNNSTLAYVTEDGRFFVAPYTNKAEQTLRDAGFVPANFYVPFSNGDVPVGEEEKWEQLREEARKVYEQGLLNGYAKWCDEHGVGELDEAILQQCMAVPEAGMIVTHANWRAKEWQMPVRLEVSDLEFKKLGHYNTNNGVTVFVYRDGRTYLTRSREVRRALVDAGFMHLIDLFVPLSSGQTLVDPALKARWTEICAK